MPHPMTLGIAAALSIAGAAVGVHLGHATVGEINPAYFQDPEVPFYSDLVPGNRPRADWAQVTAEEYQADAQTPAPVGCANCDWPVAPTPREDPAIARYDRIRYASYETVAPPEVAEAPVRIVVVDQSPERDWGRVTRYSSYPVDQAQAAPPAAAPAPAEQSAGAEGDAATQ